VVGEVGGTTITLEEVDKDIPAQLRGTISIAQKREVVERWVEEELLYQEALRRGIDREPKSSALLEKVRRDILIGSLLERESKAETAITEERIARYYDEHRDQFIRHEPEIWVRHVLVETRAEALNVRRRIVKGESFDTVARCESIEAESAANGGDLGYVSEEICDAAFWEAICSMKTGQLSGPILTDMGYHIVEVRGKMDKGTTRELDLVRSEIINAILLEAQRRDRDALLNSLRQRTPWHIYAERLDEEHALVPDSLR
jgi:peptidyl-prolyl cis-trans isomerase C